MVAEAKATIVLTAADKTRLGIDSAKRNLNDLQHSAAAMATRFGSLGALVAGAFTSIELAGVVDLLDRLDDVGEKSGIAVEQLSALRFAGEATGTPFEALATGIQRFSKVLSQAEGGSKTAAATLGALGISMQRLKTASPDELLLDVADKFATYEDGANKAALAQAFFGKSGAELIPLLNLGRAGIERQRLEAERLGVVYGGPLAKNAAAFNDNLTKLKFATEGAAVTILNSFLPTLVDISKELVDVNEKGEQFSLVGETIRITLETVAVVAGNLVFMLKATGREIGGLAAQAVALATLDFKGFSAIGEAMREDAQRASQELDDFERRILRLQDKVGGGLAGGDLAQFESDQRGRGKRRAPAIPDGGADQLTAYDRIIAKIRERTAAEAAEADAGRKLTDTERFALDVVTQLSDAKNKLTDTEKRTATARLEEALAFAKVNDERRRELELQEETAKAQQGASRLNDKVLDDLERQALARQADNRELADYVAEIGLSARQVEQLRVARLEHAAAAEEEALGLARANGATEAELQLLERSLNLLRQQIGLRKKAVADADANAGNARLGVERAIATYLEGIAQVGISAEQASNNAILNLENGLVGLFTGQRDAFRQLVDQIIADVVRLQVVRPLMQGIFGGGGGGGFFGSLIGDLFGGLRADGGPVSAGRAYVVGERGPEIFTPTTSGSIAPNGALGGVTVNSVLHVGQGVSRSEVSVAMAANNRELVRQIRQTMSRNGSLN